VKKAKSAAPKLSCKGGRRILASVSKLRLGTPPGENFPPQQFYLPKGIELFEPRSDTLQVAHASNTKHWLWDEQWPDMNSMELRP
jgi:hypothetical protein